jgi:hypothetical protein
MKSNTPRDDENVGDGAAEGTPERDPPATAGAGDNVIRLPVLDHPATEPQPEADEEQPDSTGTDAADADGEADDGGEEGDEETATMTISMSNRGTSSTKPPLNTKRITGVLRGRGLTPWMARPCSSDWWSASTAS